MTKFEIVKGCIRIKKGSASVGTALMVCRGAALRQVCLERTTKEELKMAVALSRVSPVRFGENLLCVLKESSRPSIFIQEARSLGLLGQVAPDLVACVGFSHGCSPSEDVYGHLMTTLDCVPSVNINVRLAALIHDIAKPWAWSFHKGCMGFEDVEERSCEMAKDWLAGLGFSERTVKETCGIIKLQDAKACATDQAELWRELDRETKENLFAFWVGHSVGLGRPKGEMGDLGSILARLKGEIVS